MSELIQYIPVGLMAIFIGSLIAVNKEIVKRPTFDDAEKRYKKKEVCDEIHKSVDEKLSCLPEIKDTVTEIKTKVNLLLKNNDATH